MIAGSFKLYNRRNIRITSRKFKRQSIRKPFVHLLNISFMSWPQYHKNIPFLQLPEYCQPNLISCLLLGTQTHQEHCSSITYVSQYCQRLYTYSHTINVISSDCSLLVTECASTLGTEASPCCFWLAEEAMFIVCLFVCGPRVQIRIHVLPGFMGSFWRLFFWNST